MNLSLALSHPTFLGVSRTWDPAYTYDAYRDVRPFQFSPTVVSSMVAPWMDAGLAAYKTVADMKAASLSFGLALKENAQYAQAISDYYGMRVDRTSGGKRDRLRDERAAIRDGLDRANRMLTAAKAQVDALMEAKAKSSLTVNPDAMARVQNPETGEVFYTAPSRQESPQGASMGKYMLPLAAIAAAYLALK